MSDQMSSTDFDIDLEKGQLDSSRSPTLVVASPTATPTTSIPNPPTISKAQRAIEIAETTTVPLHHYPSGYPLQAAFQSSEPGWSIYRSYDYLHSRVILDLQEQIRALERKLTNLDKDDELNEDLEFLERRQPDGSERARLLEQIRCKLLQYDEVLLKAREMKALQKPSNRDYRNFRTWFWNKKPVIGREMDFIKRREDLVSLRQGREWSSFDGFVETCVQKMHCRLIQRMFASKELLEKNGDDELVHYYSASRIEKLVGIIITMIIFILLILPVVAMYQLTSIGERNSTFDAVGVLVVFTLLFSAAMSLLTKAQRHELFAASAAYCAVLVVFISNFNNNGPGGISASPATSQ